MEKPSDFLSRKYQDLPGSKEVQSAVKKRKREAGRAPTERSERIDAYLDRLDSIANNPRGLELLKYKILHRYVTKFEDIPESYWKSQQEEARRRGEMGDRQQMDEDEKQEMRKKHAEHVLHDQRASLEQWVDYLALPDSKYIPNPLKYWIFRSVLGLSELVKKKEGDKEHVEFPKRSAGTVKPFPDINYEALAYVVDAVAKKLKGEELEFEHDIQSDEREAFNRSLTKEDFAKLYAWANELYNPIPEHLLPVVEGKWVKYEQGSPPTALVKSIRGRGTGWCTAGLNTAKTQLEGGDFYVYYTNDDRGEPTIPRLAIRMEGTDTIAEDPRGIAYKQNLDPYMGPILEVKLKEFGAVGEVYTKKSSDMKCLTGIEEKMKKQEPLTKADLIFLYEINGPIEGFGYQKDPRIKELRDKRNPKEDAPIVFDCEPEQIAWKKEDVNETTKAYVGPLFHGIFSPHIQIEHLYTSFPEGKLQRYSVEIGGKTREQLEAELKANRFQVSPHALHMMKQPEFTTSEQKEQAELIRVSVGDLFNDQNVHTTSQIYEKAKSLGLDLCPAETGPHLRLKLTDQPMNEWLRIAMKQIADPDGSPDVFDVGRGDDGSWLYYDFARPDRKWLPKDEFVFRLRK